MAEQPPGDLTDRPAGSIVGTERVHLQTAAADYSTSMADIATYSQVGMATDAELSAAVAAHAAATDPHGDRAYAAALVDDLSGVTNAATARSNLGLGTAATAASSAFEAAGAVAAHEADTTGVHGIVDTSALLDTGDIGTTVQGYSAVLAGTTASFTTADETKLDGIEAGADVTDATNVAAAGAVMASLADAKGDLLVATAADTVARLAVGTDGHVLTADTASAAGVKWSAAAGGGVGSQHWKNSSTTIYQVIPGCIYFNSRNDSISLNQTMYTPWVITEARTLSEVAITVQTLGAGNVRLAVYNADVNWQPTSLVVDLGNVSVSSTGQKKITGINTALAAGRYLVAVNAAVAVTLTAMSGCPITGMAINDSAWTSNPLPYYLRLTSQNLGGGSFPSTAVGWDNPGSGSASSGLALFVAAKFSA